MSEHPDPASMADFDIDHSTAQAWQTFTDRLADILSVMEGDAVLRIGAVSGETSGEQPYVRFRAAGDRRIVAEASSNPQLSEYFQLNAQQLALMEEIGWEPPSADDPNPSESFHTSGTQETADVLAERAVRALRDVYGVPHPAFLAPDPLGDVLNPPAARELPPVETPTFEARDLAATQPRSRAELDALLAQELTHILGHTPFQDVDGDFAIRVGSTMVFVRSSADASEVIVFSALVHDIDGRSRAMEVLSDLNTEARFVRFLLVRDRVFVSLSIFAQPLVPAHLRQALQTVSVTADGLDNDLATKLRGRTTFADEEDGSSGL